MGKASQKTTSYLVDTDTSYAQVIEERAPDGSDAAGNPQLQARYVWGQGLAPLAMWRKMGDGSVKLFFYATDGQDSVRQLTSALGEVTDSYFYDAWGNGLAGGSGTTENPFRYTGQQLDSDGRYYLRARFYNPGNGRFLSHDPLMGSDSDPISLHRYLYAGADGISYCDASGKSTIGDMVSAIGVGTILSSVTFGAIRGIESYLNGDSTSQILWKTFSGALLGARLGYAVSLSLEEGDTAYAFCNGILSGFTSTLAKWYTDYNDHRLNGLSPTEKRKYVSSLSWSFLGSFTTGFENVVYGKELDTSATVALAAMTTLIQDLGSLSSLNDFSKGDTWRNIISDVVFQAALAYVVEEGVIPPGYKNDEALKVLYSVGGNVVGGLASWISGSGFNLLDGAYGTKPSF